MAKSKIAVDLFYDVISPYARIGFELMCRNRSVWPKMDLRLKPFLLGAVMKSSKNSAPMMVPNKAMYMLEDIRRLSSMHQIPLKVPSNFFELVIKKGSLRAMRFVTAVDIITKGESTEKVSRGLWERIFLNEPGLDITENDSFKDVASKIGLSGEITEKCLKAIENDETKAKLKQNTDEAIAAGAFGAPTMLVHIGDKPEMIFGSDRIEMIAYLLEENYAASFAQRAKL
ncbi:Glutathione S-transferase kappa 1-like protein [Leptotrombidium deliense]|uniref:Glutathione S-transferase kappa n=1 Tax=Leptotrombidium deliense TaxID=299467 RepID=A0A443SID1_9ACAR|nr:Glutathione S-transferase kappa 1-like protein [Leptotrombidium deliense]